MHGLYWLTANLAERAPLLLAIDDAHWADEPSLLFVAYLARRIESLPVALVIGTREAEDATTAAVLEDIRREPLTRLLEPTPLDASGVEQLLRALDRGPVEHEFAVACHDATGGGEEHALRFEAAELARLPVSEAAVAAGEIMAAGLLADAASLRFRHPLLAGGVRASLSAPERAAAHGRAAALLRARGEGPERIALQLMRAAPAADASAAAELREAGLIAWMRSQSSFR